MSSNKKNKQSFGFFRSILLIIAIGVFAYSAYQLYDIWHTYHASGQEYENLAAMFTSKVTGKAESKSAENAASGSSATGNSTGESVGDSIAASTETASVPEGPKYPDIDDAEPPLEINWDELKKVNPEIVGWVYIDAQPKISYPICHTSNNDYYLHHTFEKQDLFAGAIFEDYHNASDFSDPNTIVYGHNMKNGSMFGMLKYVADGYQENPYFWILTPEGDYRYHIYSIMNAAVDSDVYLLYSGNDELFLEWEQKMQSQSEVANDVALYKEDKTVILSTCTSDSNYRKVVIGKCVSSVRPEKKISLTARQTENEAVDGADEYVSDDLDG